MSTVSDKEVWEAEREDRVILDEPVEGDQQVLKLVTAAVLGSLSVAVAPLASILPRLPWGIALIDPVSLFWVAAFLIGGPYVGLVATGAGTVGLFFFDPTLIGPFFKLVATLPMVTIPWLAVRLFADSEEGRELARPMFYAWFSFLAIVVRLVIMIPMNLVLVPIFFGYNDVAGILVTTISLNVIQGFWDMLIPYLVVHKTPVFENFGLW
ncbi:hypothetical protein EU538_08045 [Candidatus Thorarchaeota archaeon]|nr:MAG: hypothetical protein EU538_08045 [Candidatus Thorarchaeota archaeon]